MSILFNAQVEARKVDYAYNSYNLPKPMKM